MMKIIGIIGLILIFAIGVPTYKFWSYKENHKRSMKQIGKDWRKL